MLIGITGSFGSGKTTVARMFKKCGAYVIDADKICHSLMAPGQRVYHDIVTHFGHKVLKNNRSIDRKELGKIVFRDVSKLRLLNRIVHPRAIKQISGIVAKKRHKRVVVIDAALLVESGYYKQMDKIILVKSHRDTQINRLMKAQKMSRAEIIRIFRSQAPLKEKLALADFVIDNNKTRKQTEIQVKKIWKTLRGELCQ